MINMNLRNGLCSKWAIIFGSLVILAMVAPTNAVCIIGHLLLYTQFPPFYFIGVILPCLIVVTDTNQSSRKFFLGYRHAVV